MERAGNLSGALRAWRESVVARSTGEDPARLAEALRSYAGILELQGRWEEAIPARERAASSFAAADRPADAAAERLAAAAHLRSAASFRAALVLLESALTEAREAQRSDLEARVLGLEGNVRARMGERDGALVLVREGLTLALQNNLAGAAAEIYPRLADSLEHLGDYRAARETYDAAFAYCSANALEPTAQLCLACLTVVLRQAGEWDRAAALCRDVLDSPQPAPHARAVASGTLGLILALRGQHRPARPLLLESATMSRHIELAAMDLLSGWGLAVLEQEGEPAARALRCRAILERWRATEERHYAVSPLAGRRPSSANWATATRCGRAPRRSRRLPPTPARARLRRRSRTRSVRSRCSKAKARRRPSSSSARARCSRDLVRRSSASNQTAVAPWLWWRAIGVPRRWSGSSPRTAQRGGSEQDRSSPGSRTSSPRSVSGQSGASADWQRRSWHTADLRLASSR